MSNIFDEYPYLNVNDLNLDYILNAIKKFQNEVTNFVSINAIKYANPIQWNITSQYEKNTIVIDSLTGTAYISVAAVPDGVALTREEYWTVVFDLGSFVTRAARNFTDRYEADTTLTATFSTTAGEWLVWGDTLYRAAVNITAGDQYVVGSNIIHFTMETETQDIRNIIGLLSDLDTTDKSNVVAAINEVIATVTNLEDAITSEATTRELADNTLQDNIDAEAQAREDADSELNSNVSDLQSKVENIVDLWEIIDLKPFAQDVNSAISDPFPQGGCVFKYNNVLYVLSIMYNSTTDDCVWSVYDYDNNTLVYRTTDIPSKHSNSVTFYNGFFYCSRGGDLFVYKVPFDLSTYTTINIGSDSNYSIYYYDGDFYVAERNAKLEIIDADTLEIKNTITMDDIISPDGSATRAFLSVDNDLLYMTWLDYDIAHEMYCQVMNMSGKTISLFKYPTYNEVESITFLDGVMYVSLGIQNSAIWCKSTQYRTGVYNYDDNYYTLPTYNAQFEVYCDANSTSFRADGTSQYPYKKFYFAYLNYRKRFTTFTINLTGDFSAQANMRLWQCYSRLFIHGTDSNNPSKINGMFFENCIHVEIDNVDIVGGNLAENYSLSVITSNVWLRNSLITGNSQIGALHTENAKVIFGAVTITGEFTTYLLNLSSMTDFNYVGGDINIGTNRPSASRGVMRLFNNFPIRYLSSWDRYSKLDTPISIDNETINILNIVLTGTYALESNNTISNLPTDINLPVILEVKHLNNVYEYKVMEEGSDAIIYYRKRINAANDSGWLKIEPQAI